MMAFVMDCSLTRVAVLAQFARDSERNGISCTHRFFRLEVCSETNEPAVHRRDDEEDEWLSRLSSRINLFWSNSYQLAP